MRAGDRKQRRNQDRKLRPHVDGHGRLNAAALAEVCALRSCKVVRIDEDAGAAVIRDRDVRREPVLLAWAAPGYWVPEQALEACRRARGYDEPDFRLPDTFNFTGSGLREDRIARLLAADGIRPYVGGVPSTAMQALLDTVKPDLPIPGLLDTSGLAGKRAGFVMHHVGFARLERPTNWRWKGTRLHWRPHAKVHGPARPADNVIMELALWS